MEAMDAMAGELFYMIQPVTWLAKAEALGDLAMEDPALISQDFTAKFVMFVYPRMTRTTPHSRPDSTVVVAKRHRAPTVPEADLSPSLARHHPSSFMEHHTRPYSGFYYLITALLRLRPCCWGATRLPLGGILNLHEN